MDIICIVFGFLFFFFQFLFFFSWIFKRHPIFVLRTLVKKNWCSHIIVNLKSDDKRVFNDQAKSEKSLKEVVFGLLDWCRCVKKRCSPAHLSI